jgi:homoserine O-acetyltransferase
MIRRALFAVCLSLAASAAVAQTSWPNFREGDYVLKDFRFGSGESLPELRLHYRTLGTAKRNAQGEIVNGVLLLHGTSGSGNSWLTSALADELFAKGQPLDAAEHFIIIPDAIGVGSSSKPSDGLRAKFPHYRYADTVKAEHQLVTEHLNVRHLRLVLGSSMGGMQTWMWGYTYPDLMDGLVPLASQPIGISGRNWINRRIRIEAIKNDPEYNGGNYTKNPSTYVYTLPMAAMGTENVVRLQEMAPTREKGDEMYFRLVEEAKKGDANNTVYGIEAVMDYNPSPHLEKIKAPLLAINFEDDEGNPPELNVMEPAIKRIKGARHVLVPAGPESHGHYSHLRAKLWKAHLAEFMKTLPKR